MKRNFKVGLSAENSIAEGTAYFEFDGERATRQIEVYGERWYHADSPEDYHPELGPGLVDQPLASLDIADDHEISPAEFERAWSQARRMQMRRLVAEAMADPGFVEDMRETMDSFRHADAEGWPGGPGNE